MPDLCQLPDHCIFCPTPSPAPFETQADRRRSSRHLVCDKQWILLTTAAQEGTVADGLQSTQEQLWEDNWDDDDVEDDFQKQLRQAIAERAGGDDAMKE